MQSETKTAADVAEEVERNRPRQSTENDPADRPGSLQVVREGTQPKSLLETIMSLTENPSFDIEKFDRLIQLQQTIEERQFKMAREREQDEQRRAYNEAMRLCQADITPVVKNAWNPDTKSEYASYDRVVEAIKPIYTKHGFSVSYSTFRSERENHEGISALVAHSGGHEKTYSVDIPLDRTGKAGAVNKTGTHAFGSTMSYGRRYLALLIFNIPTIGEDKDGNEEEATITEEQAVELRKLMADKRVDEAEFLDYIGVAKLEDIYAKAFVKAKQVLTQRRVTAKKAAAR
jgi:hypothetical protein